MKRLAIDTWLADRLSRLTRRYRTPIIRQRLWLRRVNLERRALEAEGLTREELIERCARLTADLTQVLGMLAVRAEQGRVAAEVQHSRPGGARAKHDAIRAIWASGKYSSRDLCAEEECQALGMSFATARRALRGTPDPHSRWDPLASRWGPQGAGSTER